MTLYIVIIDFSKAFDLVSRSCLWHHLLKYGYPEKFVSILQGFHESMQVQVLVDGETTSPFSVVHGVKQGCVLAPTLSFCLLF